MTRTRRTAAGSTPREGTLGEQDWVLSLLVTVLPFVVLCAVVIRHGRHVRKGLTTPDGRSIAQVLDDFTREMKRANDLRVADCQHPNGTAA